MSKIHEVSDSLRDFILDVEADVENVSAQRREVLDRAVAFILANPDSAALNFICTHNSRRSHLSHVWAHIAAYRFGLSGVRTCSGGTEATACNERTAAALERSGIDVASHQGDSPDNPVYHLRFADAQPALQIFSKVYSDPPNPTEGFAAMMCCSDVDERCPVVQGSAERIPLHYLDPKASDGTDHESQTYDERCHEIAVEMFYVMKTAAKA